MAAQDSKVRVLVFAADNFACGHWRIIQPAQAMRDPRLAITISQNTQIALDSFDVAVFQRVLWEKNVAPLRMLKQIGKKLVIDYDDAFPISDPTHVEYEHFAPGSPNAAVLDEALSLADAVTVPTPELVEHYRKMHRRVVLLPSAVDPGAARYIAGRLRRASEKLTLFWSGWRSHAANLRMIEPVITRLLNGREDVVLALCGPEEFLPIFDAAHDNVIHVPPVPFEQFMRTASIADVAIAPLQLSTFNDNKSEIRLIEAGVWGVPTVASPVAAYKRFAGADGSCLLVDGNDPDQWHSTLTRILDDPELRVLTGRKARVAVTSRYLLSDVNEARADLWCSL